MASRKKDGSRTPGSGNGRLFPEMRPYVGDLQLIRFAAKPQRALTPAPEPVHTTGARAKPTVLIGVVKVHISCSLAE